MNEKIKKLAVQAGGEFYEGFAGSPNAVRFMETDLEKFAESIVKECIAMADDFELEVNQRGLVEKMKHRFGVK